MKGKQKLMKTKTKEVETEEVVEYLSTDDMTYQQLYDLAKHLGSEYSKRPKKSVLIDDIDKHRYG